MFKIGQGTFTIEKLAEVLGYAVSQVEEAVRGAIYGQGIALDQMINRNRMVPVRTGALRDSHYVTYPELRNGQWTSEIGYGAPYAAEIHERGANRPEGAKAGWRGHRMNGTPGWLRKAAYVWGQSYPVRMQRSIAAFLRTGNLASSLTGIVPTSPSYQPRNLRGKARRKAQLADVYTREQRKRIGSGMKQHTLQLVGRKRKNEEVSFLERERKKAYLAGDKESFRVAQKALEAYRGIRRGRRSGRVTADQRAARREAAATALVLSGYNLPVNTRRGKK